MKAFTKKDLLTHHELDRDYIFQSNTIFHNS